jgi:hypothetical protein
MVRDAEQPEYVIIEANERAGLANHEPQPTAERFVDLLFPIAGAGVSLQGLFAGKPAPTGTSPSRR